MIEANCSIALSYFAGGAVPGAADPALQLPGHFSYHCTAASTGWSVAADGTIVCPSRSRIVTIRLGYPIDGAITGFQLGAETSRLPAESGDPWFLEPGLGAVILQPKPFPPLLGAKVREVTLDLGASRQLLFYRLAVDGVWDDPKIYNDPIE